MNTSLQVNISNKKQYLYVWLDILGFSDILDKQDSYKELINLLKYFRNKFESIELTTKTLTISDGIVLIFELNEELDSLNKIFQNIAKIQEEFVLEKNYFLRGGMAVGTIEENEQDDGLKYLISNALSKAYNLESKFVKYPIIATSKSEIDKLNEFYFKEKGLNEFGLIKSYSTTSKTEKEEYLYFIDFMSNKKFEDILKEGLKKHQSSPQVLEKYIWLYRYYNQKFESSGDSHIGGVAL